ncbi:MAG: hypothetical protein ACXVPN_06740 [Bacteroidia bacterium]
MEEKFSIQPYLTDIIILEETVKQIQKDLAFFSLPVVFTGNKSSAYEELFGQIKPHVKKLMDENFSQLLSVLYRIDINEKQLRTDKDQVDHITDLIIKRCLQKVVFRKLFSK